MPPSVTVDPANLQLSDRYAYRDREEVLGFLAEHPHLVANLREADPEIAKRFGEQTKVTLSVTHDWDGFEGDSLFGSIGTTLGSREALDLLHRFDIEWWFERGDPVKEELVFFVGFQR
jgi:hypothetical protein